MRIRDLFSKISRLIHYYETKKTTGAPAPTAPASLAPMGIIINNHASVKTQNYCITIRYAGLDFRQGWFFTP